MGTLTTDVRGSAGETRSKRGGTDSLENEAVGLEVAVRIHGSQVAAVVLDATEHVEPFEEDTTTMIVFPRGAVVKLRARVRAGHAVVLTHLATKQTALCRLVQVNSAPNIANYVKLEFVQPAPGFWGVHFPSEGAAPVAVQPAVVHEADPSIPERMEKSEARVIPVEHATPTSVPSAPQFPLRAGVTRPESKMSVPQGAREMVKPAPAAVPSVSYGAPEHVTASEIVPLAAAPPKRVPIVHKPQAAVVPPAHRTIHAPVAPIFDSLSTGEEVFGKEFGLTRTGETALVKSEHQSMPTFARSLDTSSLMQSVEAPRTHTGMKIFLSIAASVILAAGAVFYVRQYRGNAGQSASVATPASMPQTPEPTSSSAAPTQATPAIAERIAPAVVETPPAVETHLTPKHAPAPMSIEQDGITITPVHNNARSADSGAHPTISNGLAGIYAGELTARPQPAKHKNRPITASIPTISSNPKGLPGFSANAGFASLVNGPSEALPTPAKPAEAKPVVRGGIVSAPRLLRSVQPVYPPLALSSRIEGDVQIQALIGQTGKVISTKVVSGPILLRHAATDAVKQWRYSPATLDGKPTSMEYKVTVSFHLNQ